MDAVVVMTPLFFLTGFVYAMGGLAGGSTYLALLVLFQYPYGSIPKIALLCNLIVSAGGTWHFVKARHLDLKRVLPFLITSIPAAYLGGRIPIGKEIFTLLLGLSLTAAAARLLILDRALEALKAPDFRNTWAVGLPVGAALGFFSGLVGIGGGIFLAPVLLFLRWAGPRQAAAAASLFILVNSTSGLLGQFTKGGIDIPTAHIVPLVASAFLGGQIGSRVGTGRIPSLALQRITGFLILTVALRLLENFL